MVLIFYINTFYMYLLNMEVVLRGIDGHFYLFCVVQLDHKFKHIVSLRGKFHQKKLYVTQCFYY